MTRKRELLARDDAGWTELLAWCGRLSAEQLEEIGYYPEGWSTKDLLAHVACWQAETVQVLQQIRWGTFPGGRVDVDALNQQFYEWSHDLPLWVVRVESWSAHNRMLTEWYDLPEVTPEAEEWFRESGPEHYDEHLDRLREWVAEVLAR